MLQRIRKATEEGFTLIELLIVVIILGILAAIVVFAVGSTRGDAVSATCQTDVKSIVLAEEGYFTKNGSYTTTDTDLDLLKSWPGGTDAGTDNLVFTLSKVSGDGGYTIGISGKGGASGSVTQKDTSDGTVAAQCAAS